MKTNAKLDFLMKLTETTNSDLGKALSFDASYISRIRNGKRRIPTSQPFLKPAVEILNDRISNEDQSAILEDLICRGETWPEDKNESLKLLLQWIYSDIPETSSNISDFFTKLSALSDKKTAVPLFRENVSVCTNNSESISEKVSFYYGNEGKRQAVLAFLKRLCDSGKPHKLLLYSAEEFNWLYENPDYSKKWATLIIKLLQNGGHIQIVHTISRPSGEMLIALQKWMPLYMSGAIESFYCTRLLDRIHRRTLFIAKGDSAITSTSIESATDGALNTLITDSKAVRALEIEFNNFFNLCKPLVRVFNGENSNLFWDSLHNLEDRKENFTTVQSFPSIFTMKSDIIENIASRYDNTLFKNSYLKSHKKFISIINEGYEYNEVISLPSPEVIVSGKLPIIFSDFTFNEPMFYTPDEYISHIKYIITLLKKYENYNVIIDRNLPNNLAIYAKEDSGVILANTTNPCFAFTINEPRLTAAIWAYSENFYEYETSKKLVITQLEEHMDHIRKLM